jgi:hypothetical protein
MRRSPLDAEYHPPEAHRHDAPQQHVPPHAQEAAHVGLLGVRAQVDHRHPGAQAGGLRAGTLGAEGVILPEVVGEAHDRVVDGGFVAVLDLMSDHGAGGRVTGAQHREPPQHLVRDECRDGQCDSERVVEEHGRRRTSSGTCAISSSVSPTIRLIACTSCCPRLSPIRSVLVAHLSTKLQLLKAVGTGRLLRLCMTLNLFDIYRALSQRARRYPHVLAYQEAKALGRALVTSGATKAERLRICKAIAKIEKDYYERISFGERARLAIEGNDSVVEIPYQIRHRWEESDDAFGYLYIASARTRPGELKIGATTNSPFDRERSYKSRYRYAIKIEWHEFTRAPFALEKLVADAMISHRVSGLVHDDSIEWYRQKLDALVGLVERINAERGKPL